METKNITQLTETELKAIAYDEIRESERHRQNALIIEQELARREADKQIKREKK